MAKKRKCEAIEVEICPICHEELTLNNLCVTECNHKFCMTCFSRHIFYKNSCPMCRADLNIIKPKPNILSNEEILSITSNELGLFPVTQLIKDVYSILNIEWSNIPIAKRALTRAIIQEYISGYGSDICLTVNGVILDRD